MTTKSTASVVIKPSLKIIVLLILAILLLQFWSSPAKEAGLPKPAAIEENERQAKSPSFQAQPDWSPALN
ncbi:MAG: hypothetical protein LBU69_02615 [Deltaproteobacteria bacterium]|jgi:hypothetical protein|nr:hypothetical protein [Deltaproteobacteria bacterium]